MTNQAYYYPFFVPRACVAYRMFCLNGATTSGANNIDAGIYASSGGLPAGKLVTIGATAHGNG